LWGLGIGDWGLGPIPNPQSPHSKTILQIKYVSFNLINLLAFNKLPNLLNYIIKYNKKLIIKINGTRYNVYSTNKFTN